jgi:hypothetical protein
VSDSQHMMAKLDQVVAIHTEMQIDIAEIRRDIAHHIKRTDLAEENLADLRADVRPIKKHVAMIEGAFKLLGVLAVLMGLVTGYLKILGK